MLSQYVVLVKDEFKIPLFIKEDGVECIIQSLIGDGFSVEKSNIWALSDSHALSIVNGQYWE